MMDTDLNTVVWTHIVLIDGLQPANVVVRVSNQVNIQLPFHNAAAGVIVHKSTIHSNTEKYQHKKPKWKGCAGTGSIIHYSKRIPPTPKFSARYRGEEERGEKNNKGSEKLIDDETWKRTKDMRRVSSLLDFSGQLVMSSIDLTVGSQKAWNYCSVQEDIYWRPLTSSLDQSC